MFAEYLRRGVAAGAVAGLAYGLYVALVGNPLSAYAEGIAHGAGDHAHGAAGHSHGGAAVSEATTAAVSAGSGFLWAVFLGGCFAVALYFLEPALPGREGVRSYVLAGAGFLTVSGIPWLALPPAVPGAEHAYGVDARLAAYLGLVALGALTVAAAVAAYRRFGRGSIARGAAAGGAVLAVVAAALLLAAPTVTTHPGLPADLVAAYRGLVVLSQAGLWLVLAAAFEGLGRLGIATDTTRPIDPAVGD